MKDYSLDAVESHNPTHESPPQHQPWWRTKLVLAIGMVLFLVIAGVAASAAYVGLSTGHTQDKYSSSPTATISPTPNVTSTPVASASATPAATPAATTLQVFFSKHPDSDSNTQLVYGVNRTATTASVATEALRSLFAGPTTTEQSQGLFSSWTLTGSSSCGSDGFSVTISGGKATVKLCKDFSSAGVGQDARAQAEADTTLKQFSTVQKTVYLNKNGQCLFDQSGQNLCLQ